MAGLEDLYARGLISDDALSQILDKAGPPQRPSRSDILASGLDHAKDYLAPSYLRDTPSSPQADRALADPNARPGKIGPPSGPPTTAQILGGFAGDVASSALPFGKMSGAALAKWLAANGIPWKPAEVETLRKMVNAGALDMEQLPGRTRTATANKMSQLGLGLTESPAYIDPKAVITNSPEKQAKVLDLLNVSGITHAQMAKGLGVARSTLQRYLSDELNISTAEPGFFDAPGKVDQLRSLWKGGLSEASIAAKMGTSPGNVRFRLDALKKGGEDLSRGGYVERNRPTMPQFKSMATAPDLEAGRDFAKALAAFRPQYR